MHAVWTGTCNVCKSVPMATSLGPWKPEAPYCLTVEPPKAEGHRDSERLAGHVEGV